MRTVLLGSTHSLCDGVTLRRKRKILVYPLLAALAVIKWSSPTTEQHTVHNVAVGDATLGLGRNAREVHSNDG